ncbi:MAG: PAS domain S-box protein [Acidobacteriota bacterium]
MDSARSPGSSQHDLSDLLAAIVHSSNDAIIAKDQAGRILTWNHAAEVMYGYTAAEVVGRSISILIPPDHGNELTDILARIARGERVPQYDTVRITKSGALISVSLSVSPIHNGAGDVVGASAIARDVSERNRMSTALEASERRWQAVVDAAVDGIVVIDRRGRIESFNAAAERLFGYAAPEVISRNINVLMPSPYREEHDGYLARYLATGEEHVIGLGRQVSGRRSDGSTFPLHLSVGTIAQGAELRFVGIIHDLTNRVRAEEQLREQMALARLGEMAAVIAHEVRNPLAAVSGAIQMIRDTLRPESDEATIAREVLSRLGALNNLTNDLLLFARPPRPNIVALDIGHMLRMMVRLLATDPALEGADLQLEGASALVLGDVDLLPIVLQNLLTNAGQAVKGAGTIYIAIAAEAERVTVQIRDTGPGIPPEVRARLFQPFVTTKARGTGLGLSTAKRLIEAMEGHLDIDSPPGRGTVVNISLRSAEAPLALVP